MASVGLVFDERFLEHGVPGHPERPDRLTAIRGALVERDIWGRLQPVPYQPVSADLLCRVHDRRQVELVDTVAARSTAWLDPDTYVNPDSPAIARLAAGATVDLTRAVMQGTIDRGIALVRPPGHHATERRSMGFCLFNNAALAAQWALDDGGARRVAILDIDVHHGNGTQDIFWNDPRVLYISTHQFPFYPGTGNWNEVGGPDAQGANVNIPLPAWAGERAFDLAFERVVLSALARFAPDLLLISVGFDAYWRDPLAQLQLTPAGYRRCVDEAIAACASTTGGKTVVVLEGGYDLEGIGRCAANVTLGLLDDEKQVDDVPDQALRDEPDVRRVVDQVRSVHGLNV